MVSRSEGVQGAGKSRGHEFGRGTRGVINSQGRSGTKIGINGIPKLDGADPKAILELQSVMAQYPNLILALPPKIALKLCSNKVPINGNPSYMSLFADQVMHHDWNDYKNPVFSGMYHQHALRFGSMYVSFGERSKPVQFAFITRAGVTKDLRTGNRIWFMHDGCLKSAKFVSAKEVDIEVMESYADMTRERNYGQKDKVEVESEDEMSHLGFHVEDHKGT